MNILLVEDSPMMQERLRQLISEISELTLIGVADTQTDAIKIIKEMKPDWVILDLQLAEGSGMEVLRSIQQESRDSSVAVLTNSYYPQYQKKCLNLGAKYFLDKSRDIAELEKILTAQV